jgi:hypothetical protein
MTLSPYDIGNPDLSLGQVHNCGKLITMNGTYFLLWVIPENNSSDFRGLGLGLWCLMPLSTIFQLYCGSQFYWWRKPVVSVS